MRRNVAGLLLPGMFVLMFFSVSSADELVEIGVYETPAAVSVDTWGDLVVVGTTAGLLIQDLSDPFAPQTVHEVALTDAVETVTIRGDTALVWLDNGLSKLVNLGAPGGPTVSVAPPGFVFPNLFIGGEDYLVTASASSLVVSSVTSGIPLQISELPLDHTYHMDLVVSGDVAYLLWWESYERGFITMFSLADPFAPVELSVCAARDYACYEQIDTENGYVYALGYNIPDLGIFDFNDAESPVLVREVNTVTGGSLDVEDGLAVLGNRGVGFGGPNLYRVFDVSDPNLPRSLTMFPENGWGLDDIQRIGDLVLCVRSKEATSGRTREALLMTGIPTSPGLADHLGFSHDFLKAGPSFATNEALYITNNNGLNVLDVATEDPTHVFVDDMCDPGELHRCDDGLYVLVAGSRIHMIDISVPLIPAYLGVWATGLAPRSMSISNNKAGIALSGGISFFDLSDPSSPIAGEHLVFDNGGAWVRLRDDIAVTSLDSTYTDLIEYPADKLVTYDISDVSHPSMLSSTPYDVQITDTTIIVGDRLYSVGYYIDMFFGHYETVAFDISNPAAPSLLFQGATSGFWPAGALQDYHFSWDDQTVTVNALTDDSSMISLLTKAEAPSGIQYAASCGNRIYTVSPGRVTVFELISSPPANVPDSAETLVLKAAPNPFNARVNISFVLQSDSDVSLEMYDLRGRYVRRLHDGKLAAGGHSFGWDGRDASGSNMAAGAYIFSLKTGGRQRTGRCMLVK